MGICASELREWVIRPTLDTLEVDSEDQATAENLLLGTAAQETGLGSHLEDQHRRGWGIFRITARAHVSSWDKYLIHHPSLASSVRGLASQRQFLEAPHRELITNLSYTTAIAWIIYCRAEKSLPDSDNILALGRYWARYFRHRRPLSQAREFCENYQRLVGQAERDQSIAA